MIAEETIAAVKARVNVVELIAETVKLTRRGRSFVGLCPFHQEKTPSFHVNAERGFFHCFGCKESGGAIDFVIKTEGYTFPEAVRVLAERAGIEVVDTITEAERREQQAARRSKEDLFAVNNAAAVFFERSLAGSGAHPLAHLARAELKRRGLTDQHGATLQAFRVGYAPYGWDALSTYLKQQGISPVQAERVGLLVPRQSGTGHYDRFRHRLMFAVTDVLGRVIAFSGRALPEPSPEELAALHLSGPQTGTGEAPAKYINSPESPIYTKGEHLFGLHQARQAIRQSGEAILVEGNFDVVSLHARGVGTAVAPLGTAFTAAQAKLLKRFAPSVIVLFDGDNAGRKATRAARAPCRESGLDAKVSSLPRGIDPDDFVRKHGRVGMDGVLGGAVGMIEWTIDDVLNGDAFAGGTLAERAERVEAAVRALAEERNPVLAAMAKSYADKIAATLVVDGHAPTNLRQLEQMVRGALAGGAAPASRPVEALHGPSCAILGALLDHPSLLDDEAVRGAMDAVDGDVALGVALVSRLREHVHSELHSFPEALHDFVAARLAAPMFDDAEQARRVVIDNASTILVRAVSHQEAAPDEDENARLERAFAGMKRRNAMSRRGSCVIA